MERVQRITCIVCRGGGDNVCCCSTDGRFELVCGSVALGSELGNFRPVYDVAAAHKRALNLKTTALMKVSEQRVSSLEWRASSVRIRLHMRICVSPATLKVFE